MKIYIYRNKMNENKYIELKRTNCSHYYIRQYMEWNTEHGTVKNYTVLSHECKNKPIWSRITKNRWIVPILIEQYDCINAYEA